MGCRNQSIIEGNKVKDNVVPEKEEIEVWHTYSEQETHVFETIIIPLFEQDYPDIKIKSVRQSYNEQLKSTIIGRASMNKPPDVVRMDIAWVPAFAKLELLYPVSQFADFEDVKERLYEAPLEVSYYNGNYYGIPLNTNTKVAIYNKELLHEAGYEKPPEMMEELIDIIEKQQLTIAVQDVSPWETLQYFYGLGGQLMNPTYTQSQGYLDSEASINAVKKLLELHKKKRFAPHILSGNANTWQGVLDGAYFMIDDGPWFYSIHSDDYIKDINERTVAAPFPMSNGKRAILGGENMVISKGSRNPEAAWAFVKWLTEIRPQTYFAETGLIPSNKNVDLSHFYGDKPYFKTYVESLEEVVVRPPVAHWGKIEEIYIDYFRLIFSETIGVEAGLKEAAEKIDNLLNEKEGK